MRSSLEWDDLDLHSLALSFSLADPRASIDFRAWPEVDRCSPLEALMRTMEVVPALVRGDLGLYRLRAERHQRNTEALGLQAS